MTTHPVAIRYSRPAIEALMQHKVPTATHPLYRLWRETFERPEVRQSVMRDAEGVINRVAQALAEIRDSQR